MVHRQRTKDYIRFETTAIVESSLPDASDNSLKMQVASENTEWVDYQLRGEMFSGVQLNTLIESNCLGECATLAAYYIASPDELKCEETRASNPRPYPMEILRTLDNVSSHESFSQHINELGAWIHRREVVSLVVDEIRNGHHCKHSFTRGALLEFLCDESVPNSGLIAFETLRDSFVAFDELALSCCITLRRAQPKEVDPNSIAPVLLSLLRTTLLDKQESDQIKVKTIRQCVLALGGYGDLTSVTTLLFILRDDNRFIYGHQIADSLCKILTKLPGQRNDDVDNSLREILEVRMTPWIHPSVIVHHEFFSQVSSLLAILCSRLNIEDLELAAVLVEKSANQSLADILLQHISHYRMTLTRRGFADYVQARLTILERLESELTQH